MDTFDPTAPAGEELSYTGEVSADEVAAQQLVEVQAEASEAGIMPVPAVPPAFPVFPVFPLPKRRVSGRYRSAGPGFQLELRVDVDGVRPMVKLSGDFFQVNGATVSYFGSFIVNAPTVTTTASTITVEGLGSYTWSAGAPRLRVTIPRRSIIQPPAPATAQFLTSGGTPGAAYLCAYVSRFFRSVRYEQDSEVGVTPFVSYNTGALPSGGPARVLSVADAYAEAGIEFQTVPASNLVPTAGAGPTVPGRWSNAELHASMVRHFSIYRERPQWAAWMVACREHEFGAGLLGIMFDQLGRQRQGAAVFHRGIGGTSAEQQRLQLYTYVHEIGHAFNLLHSWQKSFASPPVPNRPSALSWMNYPWNFPGTGAPGFWSGFPFQFDNPEVVHLRHAFYNNIVPGGSNFAVGAGLHQHIDPEEFETPISDDSGLQLELRAEPAFAYGEPVVVELKLQTTDTRGKVVHPHLHPNLGFVQIAVRIPGNQLVVYEPLIEHCVIPQEVLLDAANPAVYDSAYIGYGKGGFIFSQPGIYKLRAVYAALDGSKVVSDVLTLRVRMPQRPADEDVADLLLGDEQGTLLYLLGSDSEQLANGTNAFQELLDRHAKHPLAVYARLVLGLNATRTFKTITLDKQITARAPQTDAATSLLGGVIEESTGDKGVDNITLNMTMRSLATMQLETGDDEAASSTMERMVRIFRAKGVNSNVMHYIEAQVDATLTGSAAAASRRSSGPSELS